MYMGSTDEMGSRRPVNTPNLASSRQLLVSTVNSIQYVLDLGEQSWLPELSPPLVLPCSTTASPGFQVIARIDQTDGSF